MLDQRFEELRRIQVESEIHTATAINALVGSLGEIEDLKARLTT